MSDQIQSYPGVLSPEFCNSFIEKFENHQAVKADPQPEYSTRRMLFLSDKKEWSLNCMKLAAKADALVEQYFHRPDSMAETRPAEWLDDGFVMACYDPGAVCALHADGQCAEPPYNGHRIATLLFFLNDVAEGGEIHFPLQNISIKPEQGKGIIFPPGYFHPHEVLAPKTKRYIVQTWITDAEMVINYRE